MVQLIASDIDGTILTYGQRTPSEAFFSQVTRLLDAGIPFCAASGRQYRSLRQVFGPIQDRIYYLCENGAAVFGPGPEGRLISKTCMDRDRSLALCRDILAQPDCELLISGLKTSYLCPKDPGFAELIRFYAGNNTTELQTPEDMPEDFIKISAYCRNGAVDTEKVLSPRWQQYFHVAVSGEQWLDFNIATKGTGLRELCRELGVPLEQTAAFGDNFNDVPMLEAVGMPYIMSGAAPELLQRFPNHCTRVEDTLAAF